MLISNLTTKCSTSTHSNAIPCGSLIHCEQWSCQGNANSRATFCYSHTRPVVIHARWPTRLAIPDNYQFCNEILAVRCMLQLSFDLFDARRYYFHREMLAFVGVCVRAGLNPAQLGTIQRAYQLNHMGRTAKLSHSLHAAYATNKLFISHLAPKDM